MRVTNPRTDRGKCAAASAGAARNPANSPWCPYASYTPASCRSILVACAARRPQATIGEMRTALTMPVPVVPAAMMSACADNAQTSISSDVRDNVATAMKGPLQGRVSVEHETRQGCERCTRRAYGGREWRTRAIQAGWLSKSAHAALSTGPARPFCIPCEKLSLIACHSRTARS